MKSGAQHIETGAHRQIDGAMLPAVKRVTRFYKLDSAVGQGIVRDSSGKMAIAIRKIIRT
jgi:hypothetical protein